jgi:uncharacterized iron-regulated membrane protein
MIRALFVRLHRWVGLSIAGFLILVGLTGSLLAFWLDVNHWLTPELYPGPRVGVELDAASLARRAESIVPGARAISVYLAYPGTAMIGMKPREGAPQLDFEFLHLDPIDGHERGRVTWHNLPRRKSDIMPFIYGLHMYLAMNGIGDWILGAVALLWTIDCFVAFYLTLPRPSESSRRRFFARWKMSWWIKSSGSFYRLNFDFHRAGGLWLWGILLIYAWSSVYFTMPAIYRLAMNVGGFDMRQPISARAPIEHDLGPLMEWERALAVAALRMDEIARAEGFTIQRPVAIFLHQDKGLYEFRVRSSLDIGERGGSTVIYFDSRSGELKSLSLPTGHRSGTTLTTWLVELHTANLFGLPYRIFVCAMGLVITMLSVTGVYIWWKKRTARLAHARRAALRPAAAE